MYADSDRDGLSDKLEQALLTQFVPSFLVGRYDCSGVPAAFQPEVSSPVLKAENGTIYGQVFPAGHFGGNLPAVEIHFYHLWRQDCGMHAHPLDTEHVSVLVRASAADLNSAKWKAVYWYAAAHENTVCDVSQLARASTLHAEDRGAKIWISTGKHASYLEQTLCNRGCGADRCQEMTALPTSEPVNLGEPGHPMSGSLFISSRAWPLSRKMERTNFPPAAIARLSQTPETDIALFNQGRHPAQGVIAISSSTQDAIAGSGHSTISAISVAENSTGNALKKSYGHTVRALSGSAQKISKALRDVGDAAIPK